MPLDVNPAELIAHASTYDTLAARAALIPPQAAAQAQAIIASHGVMGYPVAIGILTALAPAEARVIAKTTQFTTTGERFRSHAAAYAGQDADAADTFTNMTPPTTAV